MKCNGCCRPHFITAIGDDFLHKVVGDESRARLGSDLNWERQQQKMLWGTWQRQVNKIVVRCGSYTTTYTIKV
jgi:hypothetical protein